MKQKNQKVGFLRMLLGTLVAGILENMLTGKSKIPGWGFIRAGEGIIRAGKGITREDQNFQCNLII